MKRLEDYYRVMVERGESTMLEFNKVKLKRGEIGAVISRLEREINELKMTLDYLSGGNAGLLDNAIYPGFHAPDRDSILAVRKSIHPAFLIPGKRSEAAERTIGVEKSGNLPSIGIGYASEAVAGEQFIGPTLGMTVPLWNNRGKVNAARAKHSYMQVNASGQSEYLEMEFNRTFDSWEAVKENMNIVVSVIGDSDNSLLLEKALKLGEISLIDYIVELSAIFNMVDQYHELQREYALLLSSIYEHDLVPGY